MSETVKMAFKPEGVIISINHILPMKQVKPSVKKTKKYLQIASSINEIGIIEPLIVYPQNGNNGNYLLLDGHLRFEVLKDMK